MVVLLDLNAGDQVVFEGEEVQLKTDAKAKHKIALVDFNEGDSIIMYGVLIGKASQKIEKGAVLTTANVKHQSQKVKEKESFPNWLAPDVSKWEDKTFMGYHRPDGQVGTKNVWLFFPLVFCENKNIERLKEVFEKELLAPKTDQYQLLLRSLVNGNKEVEQSNKKQSVFENIEVKFIMHQGGCGGIRQRF